MDDKDLKWEEIKTEHIVQDEWIDFRRSVYRYPDGRVFEPFYSYSRRDYTVIVAQDTDGNYICVRQFRQGIKEVTNEFPAGGIERVSGQEYGSAEYAETAIEAAKREEWVQAYLEGKGYSFLNMDLYRDEIGIDPQLDYSLDYNHYNLESAEKITHFLGDYLCRNYDFENKSSLKEYSGWNEDYEEWKNVLYPQEEERLREWRESFTGLR